MDALQEPYEEKLESVFPYLTPAKDEQVAGLPRLRGKPVHAPRRKSRSRACSSRSSPAPTANTTPPAPSSAPVPSRRSWSCATCTAAGHRGEHRPRSSKHGAGRADHRHCPAASPAATSRRAAPSSSPLSSATRSAPTRCTSCCRARDGLMLGICNGFQALIKLGLVPFGRDRGDRRLLPDADLQRHRPPPVNAGAHARGLQQVPVADAHDMWATSTPWRFPTARDALSPVRRCWLSLPKTGRSPRSMSILTASRRMDVRFNPNRLRRRHRGHHLPRWARAGQDGALRAHGRRPLRKRPRQQIPGYLPRRGGLLQPVSKTSSPFVRKPLAVSGRFFD